MLHIFKNIFLFFFLISNKDLYNLNKINIGLKKSFSIPHDSDGSSVKLFSSTHVLCPYQVCGGKGHVDDKKTRHYK